MKPELDKQLCEKYPKIFRDRNASEIESCMHWGLECGEGWYDVIDALCQAATYTYKTSIMVDELDGKRLNIEPYSYSNVTTYNLIINPPQLVADQVKEKFGTLRFYYHLEYDETISELVETKKYPKLQEIVDDYRSYFDGIVHMAETLSERTCEVTGKKGEMHVTKGGWYRTLNNEYAKTIDRGYIPVRTIRNDETVQMSPEPFIQKTK